MTRDHDGSDHPGVPEITASSEIADLRFVEAGLQQLTRNLAAATNFREFKDARDRAESWRHYVANIRAGLRMQNEVAELKIRAERRIGEELATLNKAKGGGDQRSEHRSHRPTGGPATLAELGITKDQSSDWQAVASLTTDQFEGYISEVNGADKELTSTGIAVYARSLKKGGTKSRVDDTGAEFDVDGTKVAVEPAIGGMAAVMVGIESVSGVQPPIGGSEHVEAAIDAHTETGDDSPAAAGPGPEAARDEPEDQNDHPEAVTELVTTCAELQAAEEIAPGDPLHTEDIAQSNVISEPRPEQEAMPNGTVVSPNTELNSETGPPSVQGQLGLIAALAGEACTADHIDNCRLVWELARQLVHALVPTILQNSMPVKKRTRMIRLLRGCGYKNLADELERSWATAETASTGTLL